MATKIKAKVKPSAEMKALLARSGSNDYETARAASHELAKALTNPIKQGVLKGDIIGGIFEPTEFDPGIAIEYPLDFLSPGSEKDFIAYTIPNTGRIPEKHVEGDYVTVSTFDVGASIDWALKYSRDARWDVVGRAMQVVEAMHVRKNNDDGWHTILAAGVGRNIVTYDDACTAGLFSKRSISLGKTVMRRNAGGNSTSINKGKLTDLYLSPENLEDIRSWDLTQVDDVTRREIFLAGGDAEGALTRIFGVTLHDIDELGVGQDYQTYFTSLGGTLPSDKLEIMVGLDLANRDSFVRPTVGEMEVFEDMAFHRQRRAGVYSWAQGGWSVLDSRRVLLLAA
jgi:hypothetical protein